MDKQKEIIEYILYSNGIKCYTNKRNVKKSFDNLKNLII